MIVYQGQTAVRLILNTNVNFAEYSPLTITIEYIKPSNAKGSWPALVLDAEAGTIYIDFDETYNFDESGRWLLWAKVVFSDGRIGIGERVAYTVHKVL